VVGVVGVVGVKRYVLRELSITEPCMLMITHVYACKNGELFFRQPDEHVGNEDIWYLEEGEYVFIRLFRGSCKWRGYRYRSFAVYVCLHDCGGITVFVDEIRHGWARTISEAVDRVRRRYEKMRICED
jgi:hypothetical protein